jgi:thiol-disulfide isomerase/thioredoxin
MVMIRHKMEIFGVLTALFAAAAFAGPTTQPAKPIELTDTAGHVDRPLQLAAGQKAAVIIFVASDCSICNAYAGEMSRLDAEFRPRGFQFYLDYTDPDLTPTDAREQVKAYGISFPALLDPKLLLAARLDAGVTPEVFVVDGDGKTLYHGRIDDLFTSLGQRRYEARQHDLHDALAAIADGKSVPVARTTAVGCVIDYTNTEPGGK